MVNYPSIRTFLGLLYVAEEMVKLGLLRRDPERPNNILVYREAGNICPEGWYSENIHAAMSETYNNEAQFESFIEIAEEYGVNTEKCFKDAYGLLHNIRG